MAYNVSTLAQLRSASTPAMKRAYALRLREAAEIIAIKARAISAGFSKRIPISIVVRGGTGRVWIEAGGPDGSIAPNAYPFETGARHPLFGSKTAPWYPQPKRPFLIEAGEAAIEQAAEAFSQVFDDWCKELDL